jgi:sugar lactone lactonase YvrE
MPELRVLPVPDLGTEDVVVARGGPDEGCAYTGTAGGTIWRVTPDGRRVDRVAVTGGRPLGLELEPDGRLLVCDAHRGVLRVDPRTGGVEPVVDRVSGRRMRLVDNASIAADGTVWFSDSSTRYGLEQWKHDFVQDTRTGRLLRHHPDGTTEVALDGLAFANGVALAPDESWVAVAETVARRVTRLWLSGERAGRSDVLLEDLPGYPDNLSLGTDGLLWVALASPTDPAVERLLAGPRWVRRAVTMVPERLQPQPKPTIHVQGYDVSGPRPALRHDLDLRHEGFGTVTGVRELDGRLWLGSLTSPALAWVDLR